MYVNQKVQRTFTTTIHIKDDTQYYMNKINLIVIILIFDLKILIDNLAGLCQNEKIYI